MGIELTLCTAVTLSKNAITSFSGVKLSTRSFLFYFIDLKFSASNSMDNTSEHAKF